METNTSINWFRVVEASTSATGYWTDGVTFTSAGSSFCSTTNDLWEISIPRSAMSMVNLSGTFSFSVAVACNTAGVPCEAPGSDVMDAMTTTGPNTFDEVGDGTLNFYTNPTLRDILCASYSYPYTMTSTAQSELVDAIQCANANGLSADVINLNGLTVSLIAATPFANYSGQTGLPQITSNISIRNGTIFHDMSGGGFLFRTFSIASGGTLNLQNMLLSGASAPTPGGAFHNSGTLNVTNSTMHGYDTGNRGGDGDSCLGAVGEVSGDELALELNPGHEEEDRQESVGRPLAEGQVEMERARPDSQIPQVAVCRVPGRVGPDQGEEGRSKQEGTSDGFEAQERGDVTALGQAETGEDAAW